MSKLKRTMRVDFVKNSKLAKIIAERMKDKKQFPLEQRQWIIDSFRRIESTNYITVYMTEA